MSTWHTQTKEELSLKDQRTITPAKSFKMHHQNLPSVTTTQQFACIHLLSDHQCHYYVSSEGYFI